LKLVSGYQIIYGKVKEFVKKYLFKQAVNLENIDTIKNLSEPHIIKLIIDIFKKEINSLTLHEKSEINIKSAPISLTQTKPFVIKERGFLSPKKSVFNKIVGDNNLELEFASFLDNCDDIVSYTKNYLAVGFKMDYVNHEGNLKNYFPDFLVQKSENEIYVVETKGREDLNDPLKIQRLKQFCSDVSKSGWSVQWAFIFVDEEGFKKYRPTSFQSLIDTFRKYQ
ncbi:MAG: type III restriction endonuclease subunit R, partial [Oligoflexia bacterium]|nr:type III restriction endonuclease subunit R [Oligoflexia bacterium]